MKFAFYCDYSKEFKNKIETLENGNVGIGGTQYLFMLVVSNLQKKYNSPINKYLLLSNKKININSNVLQYKQVKNLKFAHKWCEENKYNYLIIRANSISEFSKEDIRNSKVKFILWAHNYIDKIVEKILYLEKNVVKLICVSQQQYINMQTSIAYKKMDYINNCIGSYTIKENAKQTENLIYMGVPAPSKGLHNAIKIFRLVKRKVPKAKLIVIGSLKVRNDTIKLGKLNITYKCYEDYIIKLINKYNLKEDIVFLGNLDFVEVKKVIEKYGGVGMVNPSYCWKDETFCLSAIEFESFGIPVVSRRRNDGLNTSIKQNETGFLELTDRKIAKRVGELFTDKQLYYDCSKRAKDYSEKFKSDKIVDIWYEKLNEIEKISNINEKKQKKFLKRIVLFLKKCQNKILTKKYVKWMR